MKLGGITISSSHRTVLLFCGIFYLLNFICERGCLYYERGKCDENKAYPCDHLLYSRLLRICGGGVCFLDILGGDNILQAGISHVFAHMDSLLLVQHVFFAANMQAEKGRHEAMGYRQGRKKGAGGYFNGTERCAALLLDICLSDAVY